MPNVRKRSSVPARRGAKRTKQPASQVEQLADSVCRVCMRWASSSAVMVRLFDRRAQETSLAEVLALVGAVEPAKEDDPLPKWCCKSCVKGLEGAYKMRLMCQDSDRKLRDVYMADVEPVAVKEEVDEDEFNPLDELVVESKPDIDGMSDAKEAEVTERLELPKLEILDCGKEEDGEPMEENDVSTTDGVEDCAGVESDVDEGEAKDEKPPKDTTTKPTKNPINPDVYDEVPAVGFSCCGCKNKFKTLKELQSHSKEVHLEKKLSTNELKTKKQCDICYKVLRNDFAVQSHQQKEKLNFRCKVCGDLFWSRKRVCLHHDRVHGPNPTIQGPSKICCACLEQFETEEQLKEHSIAVHLPEKPPPNPDRPFVCNICYRCYKSDAQLYGHQSRMLKSIKKHMCVQCGMLFRHPGALQDHESVHTGEKTFQCPKCPKTYAIKESFRKHLAGHTMPEDKYKCETCGICFKTHGGLKQHKPVHTGERPHKCPHCPASYAGYSGIKSHLLTHTVQKSLECPLCRKQFKRYSEVRQHVRFFHQKLKPFACFFCPKQYPRKDYRKRHMVSAHPEELRNNPLPAIELFGNPRWAPQKSEEAIFREQGMVE
ncbi:gastrula zinc finger protein XlCGF26.1-like [Aedes albopictus]|uniref:C2h2-type zn-finger protein n=1 Tax=Aedes albopictus TaxID=7160 RepID=A0ABM1YC79_AEDAL|nr:gastrula zinc finger protein XlCGF26.1-like [Aedes albopictus]